MKKEFTTAWKSSKLPRKQRKYKANAPMHLKRKFLSVNLAKSLRGENGRNIEIRKGDTVKIMRGKFKGKEGKINEVKTMRQKIYIEGIQKKKADGSKVNVAMRASNLQIVQLDSTDKKRFKKNLGKTAKKTADVKVKKGETKQTKPVNKENKK